MGNQEIVIKRKEIEQVYPNSIEEKENMIKPYINKPVPDMYVILHIDCNCKWVRNTFTVLADSQKSSHSATAHTSTPISSRSSSQPKTRPMFFAYASEAKRNLFAIMHTKSTWALTSDILL
jgi:hypothetical protein